MSLAITLYKSVATPPPPPALLTAKPICPTHSGLATELQLTAW